MKRYNKWRLVCFLQAWNKSDVEDVSSFVLVVQFDVGKYAVSQKLVQFVKLILKKTFSLELSKQHLLCHFGSQCPCVLYSVVLISGHVAFIRFPVGSQNGECITVVACDLCMRGGRYFVVYQFQGFKEFSCKSFKRFVDLCVYIILSFGVEQRKNDLSGIWIIDLRINCGPSTNWAI